MPLPLAQRTTRLAIISTIVLIVSAGCDSQSPTDSGANNAENFANGQCGTDATLISAIQGRSDVSPLNGKNVLIEAVVTANAPQLNGFFVQEETNDHDNDPMTSEGIFIFSEQDVHINQLVRISGVVNEVDGRTQLRANSQVTVCTNMTLEATPFELPTNHVEAFEGMLVQTNQPLVINSTHHLASVGEIGVSTELLFTPTQVHVPGSADAIALVQSNRSRRITLDDFSSEALQDLDLYGAFDSDASLRIGSTISSLVGVVDEQLNTYRIRLTKQLEPESKARPSPPDVQGDIVIAAFNVLNLFNGDGQNGGFRTDRGAKSAQEYTRQQTKLVNAILPLSPDVIGLNEIENDGDEGERSAVFQLTGALNEAMGFEAYDYIAYDSTISGASIANAIVYRKDKIEVLGETKVLTSENSMSDGKGPLFSTEKSRPAITQAFSPIESDASFVVSVNHLKSKGSPCGDGDDSSEQGNCNITRTRAAQGLAQWLTLEYPNLPIFIIGDLNSYAQEDPIQALINAGFTDAVRDRHGSQTYTYSFRGQLGALDYVMANGAANDMVVFADEWHINAAEPRVLDYSETLPGSDQGKPAAWLNENEFRSSDHDPVVIGIAIE